MELTAIIELINATEVQTGAAPSGSTWAVRATKEAIIKALEDSYVKN